MLKPTSNCPKEVWEAYNKDPRPWSSNKKPSLKKVLEPTTVVAKPSGFFKK